MSFIEAIKTCFRKYATFQGRAGRAEFWYFALFYILAATLIAMLGMIDVIVMLFLLLGFFIIAFMPTISVSVRRLHDIDRTGWWYLPTLLSIPLGFMRERVGAAPLLELSALLLFAYMLFLLYCYIKQGTPGDNRFGPNPYGDAPAGAQ